MSDKENLEFTGPNGERGIGKSIPLPAGLGALLAGLMVGGLGGPRDEANPDHPLLKKLGVTPPLPFRAATKEEFLSFFNGWSTLKIGDIVEIREGFELDQWPTKGEKAIVSQILETPIRRGTAYTEQMGRRNDVALMFVSNTDTEVVAAMAEAMGEQPEPPHIAEFLYDSRRLKKVGSVFE